MPGKFIVLEGPDGSGKSTMIESIREHLAGRGVDAEFVRDPGGTAIGQQIRTVLLDPANQAMCPATELMLYIASRAQLVAEVIRPTLDWGKPVIADRFYLSTLVYQGVTGAVPPEVLEQVVHIGTEAVVPDLVLLLDVPAEVGLARVGREQDRMEQKGLAFFEQVRANYQYYAQTMPAGSLQVIDASEPLESVRAAVVEAVDGVL